MDNRKTLLPSTFNSQLLDNRINNNNNNNNNFYQVSTVPTTTTTTTTNLQSSSLLNENQAALNNASLPNDIADLGHEDLLFFQNLYELFLFKKKIFISKRYQFVIGDTNM